MKKIILSLSFIAALILVILSCRKNFEPTDSLAGQNTMNQNSQNIEQRILTHRSALESGLKSGNDYTIDTAVWYTEALINFTYADVTNNLEGLYVDSVFVDVGLNDGKITLAEAASVYDDIIDSLTVQYENLPSQNLHLIFADVFSRDSTAGSVTFVVISAFGFGPIINLGTFHEDDWWMLGWRESNCGGYCAGPYEGTQLNSDAALEIALRIRQMIAFPAQRHYAIDVLTVDIYPDLVYIHADPPGIYNHYFLNENDEIIEDNLFDYLLVYKYSNYPNFDSCLCPDEMNFYLQGTKEVSIDEIYEVTDPYLGERVFMSIEQFGDDTYHYPQGYFFHHKLVNTYGIWVYTSNVPELLD